MRSRRSGHVLTRSGASELAVTSVAGSTANWSAGAAGRHGKADVATHRACAAPRSRGDLPAGQTCVLPRGTSASWCRAGRGGLEGRQATSDVAGHRLCADPHRSGDLGVWQVRVIPEHQGFALPGRKGVKGRHEGLRGGDGWLPGPGQRRLAAGRGGAGCMVGSCPDDHFPQQVGQGLIAVPQVPPSAVHGGEGGLDYFFCRGNVDHQESGQPGKGTVVRVIKHGNRLVSIPSGPGRRPAHPGARRVVSGVRLGTSGFGADRQVSVARRQ